MSIKEVPRGEWAATLEAFGREHRAWLASVEHRAPDGSRDVWLAERPLAGVFADREGARVVAVRIELAPESAATNTSSLRIDDPAAVRLEVEGHGAASALQIDDENGGRTSVRFRVSPPVEILDGVAPAEV
jgi:hypothetical protein